MAAGTVALVAGSGRLPFEIARGVRAAGRRVLLTALEGFAEPALAAEADDVRWLALGELDALVRALRDGRAEDVVLAGHVAKEHLFSGTALLRLDARARDVLARLTDRRDDAILRALADVLEAEGFRVVSQATYVPGLLAREGPLGALAPTPEQLAEVAFGWPIAKAIGRLDIGQTVVVRERTVLAVEAIEGTDAAIRRGGALGRGGVCVIKVWKPAQDPRLDFPTIGPETIAVLREAGASLLAVEAGRTLVLEGEAVATAADAAGVCVLGHAPEGGGAAA